MATVPVGSVDDQPATISDPNGRWCWWALFEIFMGEVGEGKYVPKVKDYVMDTDTYTAHRVDAIDPVTYIPTLVRINPGNADYVFTETDVLFGVGPGTQADTYRVYVDKSKLPYTLAVDTRLRIAGTMSQYCKIFRGSVVDTENGNVISRMYDSNGQYISENVPLELAAIDSHNNYSIKIVAVCNTLADMPDGEIVTAVLYRSDGTVVSKRQLLVENSSFIRDVNVSKKYVTGITLESPFMSPTIENQIDFPLNVPKNALNLIGVVSYSDGSTLKLPVDGTKFTMFGLSGFMSDIVGRQSKLVLSYSLSANETAFAGVGFEGNSITEPYNVEIVDPNNSYTVKLFGYPFWVDSTLGYQMRWLLLNLDRNIVFDVTGKVIFNANTGPFDPKGYGYTQQKSVSINLRDVSGAFKPFIHTQLVEIVLMREPDNVHTPWMVGTEASTTRPNYGEGLFAKKVSDTSVNLSSGIVTYAEWKQRAYLQTYPLVNKAEETTPVDPTHFTVSLNGISTTYPIEDWNVDINIGNTIPQYGTVSIQFLKRVGSSDLILSAAAMIIYT